MITECGLFGFHLKNTLDSHFSINCLKKIQHRGQDSYGLSYIVRDNNSVNSENVNQQNEQIQTINKIGLVEETDFFETSTLISHVRYSTSGYKDKNLCQKYCQPFQFTFNGKPIAICFNGNIPKMKNHYPNIDVDSFGIKQFIMDYNNNDIIKCLVSFQETFTGVFNLMVLYENEIYLCKDRHGVRPLSIYTNEKGTFISSETCLFNEFDNFNNRNITDILAGQIYKISSKTSGTVELVYQYMNTETETLQVDKELKCIQVENSNNNYNNDTQKTFCLFEFIYFMRPNSTFKGINVHQFRDRCGEILANYDNYNSFVNRFKYDVNNMVVVGCPNSGIESGISYAKHSNLIYKQVIHKVTKERTFILPSQEERINALQKKYSFDCEEIKDKIIIVVDDSIVRGNTLKIMVEQLWECKPLAIYVRIASPKVISQCYYGIDIPTKEELLVNRVGKNDNDLEKFLNVTSLKYIEIEDINKGFGTNYCMSCFTGKYNDILDF